MANQRKGISKKLRFEVFKRDSFTCQYCGRNAPDVILEVDHINPVKDGGKNNIMNLITSCFDCNRGKGAKALSDNQVIKQQHEQLKELSEKREQLKLLLQWKKELENFDNEQIDIINDMIKNISDREMSDYGRRLILKAIKKYGISEVVEVAQISIDQYFKDNNNNIGKVIEYIPKICASREKYKECPALEKLNYIKAIMRNRFGISNEHRTNKALREILEATGDWETLIYIVREARNWTEFWNQLNETYNSDY